MDDLDNRKGEGICTDTYVNCVGSMQDTTVYRPCTDEEKRVISLVNVFIKQVISLVLLAVAVWYLYIERFQTSPPRFFEDAFSVGICKASTAAASYSDGGESFCQIKVTMTVLSLVLLVPYWLQTQAQVAVIMVSCINPEVLVPVSKGEYVGYESDFEILFSHNVLKRTFLGPIALVTFIVKVFRRTLTSENTNPVTACTFLFEVFWKFFVFVLPDMMLTASLFLIAIFLMQNSNSTDELFVNIVAVQVFAEIDDILVKLLVARGNGWGNASRVFSPAKIRTESEIPALE